MCQSERPAKIGVHRGASAVALAIPSDLREVADVFGFGTLERWRTVILPGIFPHLITGLVTASGGAWNASIIAEYFHFKGQTLQALGLGAQISSATDTGNSDLLPALDTRDGDVGGVRQPVGVAALIPVGGDALQAGKLTPLAASTRVLTGHSLTVAAR